MNEAYKFTRIAAESLGCRPLINPACCLGQVEQARKFENIPKGAAARNYQVHQKNVIQKKHDLVVFLNGRW
jgi:hypothetical protein